MIYCNPASHGEGRFVANEEWLAKLFANGQVATQYVTSMETYNETKNGMSNGSYMRSKVSQVQTDVVLGKMAHTNVVTGVAINIYGEQDIRSSNPV